MAPSSGVRCGMDRTDGTFLHDRGYGLNAVLWRCGLLGALLAPLLGCGMAPPRVEVATAHAVLARADGASLAPAQATSPPAAAGEGTSEAGTSEPGATDPHVRRLLEAAGAADRALAPPSSAPQEIQNLLVEAVVGSSEHPEDDASAIGSIGINYGGPLPIRSAFDYQVGADITKREGARLDIHVATGVSLRDEEFRGGGSVLGDALWGAGIFFDYFRTREDTDLFGLRGTFGVSLPTRHHLGWRGRFPLNEDDVLENGVPGTEQKLIVRNDLVWGVDFFDRFAGELALGYLAGDVDEPIFGIRCGYSTDNKISLIPAVEFTPDGEYAATLLIRYEFSDHKVPALITRYVTQGSRDHTPFPLASFTELIVEPR